MLIVILQMLLAVAGVVALLWVDAGAFYVPGVAPVEFHSGDPVEVKVCVNIYRLTVMHTEKVKEGWVRITHVCGTG